MNKHIVKHKQAVCIVVKHIGLLSMPSGSCVGLGLARSVFHPLRPAPRPSLDKHVKLSVNDATTRDSVSISVNYRYQL